MDNLSKNERSLNMAKIKSQDSLIETKFRKLLWHQGFRYKKNASNYIGKPDLILKKFNTVIFIDSCFWHKCKLHSHTPKSNIKFWKNKLAQNKKRDEKVTSYYITNKWKIF